MQGAGDQSDHDLLTTMVERMDGFKSDLAEIKLYMANRPCPSNLCQQHDRDIERLNTTIKVVAGIAIFAVPLLLSLIFFLTGGRVV